MLPYLIRADVDCAVLQRRRLVYHDRRTGQQVGRALDLGQRAWGAKHRPNHPVALQRIQNLGLQGSGFRPRGMASAPLRLFKTTERLASGAVLGRRTGGQAEQLQSGLAVQRGRPVRLSQQLWTGRQRGSGQRAP